ncbi:hypothetical protein PGB90_006232 [Kerria lacca]
MGKKGEYDVERIIKKRILRGGKIEYFIKWENYPDSENTWEPEENLENSKDLIAEFEAKRESELKKQQKSKGEEPYDFPEVSGFEKGFEPEKIVGATDNGGSIKFLIKWKNTDDMELVPNTVARQKCPHLVIKFYEQNIKWENTP